MTSVPLHPALVHIPLGLAFLLPALALGLSWALWKGRVQRRAWLLTVVLQAVLLGAGLLAMNSGQQEEDRVESVVPKAALEAHEEYAEQFLWATGVTLAAAGLVLALRRPAAVRTLAAMTVLGTLIVAAAALRVGHAGGQLVYVHNAAAAYSSRSEVRPNVGKQPKTTPLDRTSSLTSDED